MYVNLVKDFNVEPFGRYRSDTESPCTSGEEAREAILKPIIDSLGDNEVITVDLTGSNRFHLSWLEECFGGLIRNHDIGIEYIKVVHNNCKKIEDDAYEMMNNAWRLKHGF